MEHSPLAGVVKCKLPVEVSCRDGVASLAGLVVTELEVSTVPGDTCGGSKNGVRVEVGSELGWVWVSCTWFGGVGVGSGFGGPPPNASPLDNHVELFRSFRHDCCA